MKNAAPSAHVRSVEAIDAFRTALNLYYAKARPLLEDAWEEVARTREWIHTDRRRHWENEVRKRKRQLEDAEQALFSARFSTLRQVRAAEQQAVQRARRALAEAEAKLERVRHWSLEFDNSAAPLLKYLEELRTNVTTESAKAAAYLGNIIRALETYAGGGPVGEPVARAAEPAQSAEPAQTAEPVLVPAPPSAASENTQPS